MNLIHIQAGEGSYLEGASQKLSASSFLIFAFLYKGFLLYYRIKRP